MGLLGLRLPQWAMMIKLKSDLQIPVAATSSRRNLSHLSRSKCYLYLHHDPPPQPSSAEEQAPAHPDDYSDRCFSLTTQMTMRYDYDDVDMTGIKNENRLKVDLANTRCIGSSCGWLGYVNRTTHFLHLLNPFYLNAPIIPLPPIESLPFILRSVCTHSRESPSNNSNTTTTNNAVVSGGGAYSSGGCLFSSKEFIIEDESDPIPSEKMMGVTKFALSHCPLLGRHGSNNNNNEEEGDATVVILCNRKLAFCRVGDVRWTALKQRHYWAACRQVAYSNKDSLFYAIFDDGIEAWDLQTDPSSPRLVRFICMKQFSRDIEDANDFDVPRGWEIRRRVLRLSVDPWSGELWCPVAVTAASAGGWYRESERRRTVAVYRTRSEGKSGKFGRMERCGAEDLGDLALLVDKNQSVFVSPSLSPGILKPSSVHVIRDNKIKQSPTVFSIWNENRDKAVLFPLISTANKTTRKHAFWVAPPAFP